MYLVSSYRDRLDPEVVHFPGSFASRTLLAVVAFLCVATVPVILMFGYGWLNWVHAGLVVILLAVIVGTWPRRICIDDVAVSQFTLFGKRHHFIRHEDMAPVVFTPELRTLAWMTPRRASWTNVVMRSTLENKRIVHTPRHSDRDRFLSELHRRGATIEEID